MLSYTKTFAQMTTKELHDGIGRDVLVKEMNGNILIGTLKEFTCHSDAHSLISVTVNTNGEIILWDSSQWMNAVFV